MTSPATFFDRDTDDFVWPKHLWPTTSMESLEGRHPDHEKVDDDVPTPADLCLWMLTSPLHNTDQLQPNSGWSFLNLPSAQPTATELGGPHTVDPTYIPLRVEDDSKHSRHILPSAYSGTESDNAYTLSPTILPHHNPVIASAIHPERAAAPRPPPYGGEQVLPPQVATNNAGTSSVRPLFPTHTPHNGDFEHPTSPFLALSSLSPSPLPSSCGKVRASRPYTSSVRRQSPSFMWEENGRPPPSDETPANPPPASTCSTQGDHSGMPSATMAASTTSEFQGIMPESDPSRRLHTDESFRAGTSSTPSSGSVNARALKNATVKSKASSYGEGIPLEYIAPGASTMADPRPSVPHPGPIRTAKRDREDEAACAQDMEEEMRKKRRRIEKIKAKKDLPKTSKAYPCPFKDCASGACESQGIRRHLRESHGHKSLWSCGCGSCFKVRSSREAHALRCERAYVLQQGWDKTVSDVKKALDDNNILPEWMETSQVWVGDLGRVLRVWADGKGNLGPRQGRAKNAGSKLPGK